MADPTTLWERKKDIIRIDFLTHYINTTSIHSKCGLFQCISSEDLVVLCFCWQICLVHVSVPSGNTWRLFLRMLSSRNAWSFPIGVGSTWISLQLMSWTEKTHILYINNRNTHIIYNNQIYFHTLTSSVRSLAFPISSGIDKSLLLLTTSTFRGRLKRNLGRTDSWFRLKIQGLALINKHLNLYHFH